jgi:hypothetical protein
MNATRKSSVCKPVAMSVTVMFMALVIANSAFSEQSAQPKNEQLPLSGIVLLNKNAQGQATSVVLDEKAETPKALLDLLPAKKDTRKLTKEEIRQVAEKNRLFNDWDINPVLRFQDGDISAFSKEDLPAWNIELQFLARRIVIEAAEREKAKIPSQGDLSALSNPVFSWLYDLARKKWEKDTK